MLKTILLTAAASILSVSVSAAVQRHGVADYHTIPLPHDVAMRHGRPFLLGEDVSIVAPDSLDTEARILRSQLGVSGHGASSGPIVLSATLADFNPEAYTLNVTGDSVVINGASRAGVFRAIMTLVKSLPSRTDGEVLMPAVGIYDRPRFAYRGMHLDVARHFFPVSDVKTYIDMMALHGMNTLHLHLTDDQGWRVEIKRYPRLTTVGSHRDSTIIGRTGPGYDHTPVDGFYTRADVDSLVRYAADRHIQIIPEIDLPSHMLAALAAYPELGCTGGPYSVWGRWGINDDVLCPGNDLTLEFIADVLEEVMDMFPAPYIHIGGDECPRVRWQACPKCQARIAELGLVEKDGISPEAQLQEFITRHACEVVRRHGKSPIGWDELLECEAPADAIIMSWHGVTGAIEGTRRGHRVILTPSQYCYFDYFQSPDGPDEPFAVGGLTSVEKVYSLEPCPAEWQGERADLVMGVQANLWTEYIKTFDHVCYNVLPRMAALSEVQWVDADHKDYEDFRSRIPHLMDTYEARGYNYARHVSDVNVKYHTNHADRCLEMTCTALPGYDIRYTLDGSEPTMASTRYVDTVRLDADCIIKVNSFAADGRAGRTVCDTLEVSKLTFGVVELVDQPYYVYAFQGAPQLVDGLKGTRYFRTGRWLGFSVKNLDAVVTLPEPTELSKVSFRTVVKPVDALADAVDACVYGSVDGEIFTLLATETYRPDDPASEHHIESHTLTFDPVELTKVRVVIRPVAKLPAEHPQGGWPALMFVDELRGW
ncbi:MAG: family 20 glycosylhydrolase [Bacteroides sp.]|nr:family 20 glycosylhydrolase [Bacteroides sp.]